MTKIEEENIMDRLDTRVMFQSVRSATVSNISTADHIRTSAKLSAIP